MNIPFRDTPVSVEEAIKAIVFFCQGRPCNECPYSTELPKWNRYACMFNMLDPCDWKFDMNK